MLILNLHERSALKGLRILTRCIYCEALKPYMDRQTLIVGGRKRRISLQSIREELFVEPRSGIKSGSPTKAMVRSALEELERAGLVERLIDDRYLVFKCPLAQQDSFDQNKLSTMLAGDLNTNAAAENIIDTRVLADLGDDLSSHKNPKVSTPLIKENYIYLLQRFEHFWRLYPEKKSRDRAFETFKQIDPDESLLRNMLQALDKQIKARQAMEAHGKWVPAWKYPANWLAQKCWEDEVKIEVTQEKRNAKPRTNTERTTHDPFWNPEPESTEAVSWNEQAQSNVINLQRFR